VSTHEDMADDRIRAMLETLAGPGDPLPPPAGRRRTLSRRAVVLALVVLIGIPLGIAQASGTFDGARAVDPVPAPGTPPYGPATIAVAKLTRVYFDCMVAQGATVRRDDRDTVALDGETPANRAACATRYAALLAAQATPAAQEERAARQPLIQEWDRCATSGGPAGTDGTPATTPAEITARLSGCETTVLRAHGQEAAAARIQEIVTP
jgi:hypothetical protein